MVAGYFVINLLSDNQWVKRGGILSDQIDKSRWRSFDFVWVEAKLSVRFSRRCSRRRPRIKDRRTKLTNDGPPPREIFPFTWSTVHGMRMVCALQIKQKAG